MPKSKLRYGFKAEANKFALEFREELSLSAEAPLNPTKLAQLLGIPLIPASEFNLEYTNSPKGREEFSAAVFFDGPKARIIYNDFQHPNRQNSSIAHEIAHVVLRHSISQLHLDTGDHNYYSIEEEEARELSATLLISNEGALFIHEQLMKLTLDMQSACEQYGVSKDLMNWRLRASGAVKRFKNRNRKKFRSLQV